MKYLALAATVTLSFASLNANAAKFEKADDRFETNACYVAATEGLDAVRALAKENDVNVRSLFATTSCNGLTFKSFAKKHQNKMALKEDTAIRIVSLTSVDRSPESQLCLDSVVMGEKAARQKHGILNGSIKCNGKDISDFSKSFNDIKVLVDDTSAE
jgi:hypothetical protein